MKRKPTGVILFMTISIYFISTPMVTAEMLGNPGSLIDQGAFKIGIEAQFADREIDVDSDYTDQDEITVDTNFYLLSLTYGILNRLNISAKIGKAEIGTGDAQVYILKGFEIEDKLALGAGCKALLYQENDIDVGLNFQVFKMTGKQHETDIATMNGAVVGTWEATFDVSLLNYILSLGANFKLNEKVSLYGAITYTYLKGSFDLEHKSTGVYPWASFTDDGDITSSNKFGILIGGELYSFDYVTINAEIYFINFGGFALSVGHIF